MFISWENNAYLWIAIISWQQKCSQRVWSLWNTWYLHRCHWDISGKRLEKSSSRTISHARGSKPVRVICRIKRARFLPGIWHLSLTLLLKQQQAFVVRRLNLSFQGYPESWLKSWGFGIMRLAIVACPPRHHSNACLLQLDKSPQRQLSFTYEVRKESFEWGKVWNNIDFIVFDKTMLVLNDAVLITSKCARRLC